MKQSTHKYEYDKKYHKENYDRMNIVIKKGKKELYKKQAESEGLSLNKWITQILDEKIGLEE